MEDQLWLSVLLIGSTEQDSKTASSPQPTLLHSQHLVSWGKKMFLKSLV